MSLGRIDQGRNEESLLRHAGDVVVEMGVDGRILTIGESVERILGRPAASFVGKSFLEVVVPEDREASLAAFQKMIETGAEPTVNFRVPRNDRVLRMRGVVAWLNPNQSHPVHSLPPGFGFCFIQPTPEDMKLVISAIQDYCRSNPLYRQYL